MAQIDPIWSDRMLSVLRIIAALLFLQHGLAKYFGFPHVAAFDNLKVLSLVGLAGAIEIVGSVLLLLGLFTRPAAFIMQVGFVNAIPPTVAVIAMYLWAWHSDRKHERTWHVVIACLAAAAGLALAGIANSIVSVVAALTLVNIGISSAKPPLWSMRSIETTGYKPGQDVVLALDCAATEFFKNDAYHYEGEGKVRAPEAQAQYLSSLVDRYPIVSIEDGMVDRYLLSGFFPLGGFCAA